MFQLSRLGASLTELNTYGTRGANVKIFRKNELSGLSDFKVKKNITGPSGGNTRNNAHVNKIHRRNMCCVIFFLRARLVLHSDTTPYTRNMRKKQCYIRGTAGSARLLQFTLVYIL